MSQEALRIAISEQFRSLWKGTPLDRVDWGDNRKFDPGSVKFVTQNRVNDPWVRLSYTEIDTENAEVGTKFKRTTGIITVQCFIPINSGEKAVNKLIDAVEPVFENKAFGGVQCFAVGSVKIGSGDGWFQKNAKADFKFDVFS